MNARAGVVTSQVAWLASLPITTEDVKGAVAGFFVAALASYGPDLDHGGSTAGKMVGRRASKIIRKVMGGHRAGTHSLAAVAGAWFFVAYFFESPTLASAMAVGWASHIFCDIWTVEGVSLLYFLGFLGLIWAPLWALNKKTRIGWMVTGSSAEDRYITYVKIVGVMVSLYYAYLIYDDAIAWTIERVNESVNY